MKVETKVYLPPDIAKALDQLAARTRRPKSEIVRAAVASFMSPDGAERTEAALLRRLDRMNRHMERVERETQVGNEALAIFIRTWLTSAPRLTAQDHAAAQAMGRERYGEFLDLLARRLSTGSSLADQVFETTKGAQAPGGPDSPD